MTVPAPSNNIAAVLPPELTLDLNAMFKDNKDVLDILNKIYEKILPPHLANNPTQALTNEVQEDIKAVLAILE